MKRQILTLLALLLISTVMNAQTKTFKGAWFKIDYPANFTAKGSLPSTTAQEGYFDSAIFTSPDGKVEFYIFSPQWGGEPSDIALKPGERAGKPEIKKGKYGKVLTYWSISAKNGSYTRSYQETRSEMENTCWVIGIKYADKKSYNRYKKQYQAFKASLQQYAD